MNKSLQDAADTVAREAVLKEDEDVTNVVDEPLSAASTFLLLCRRHDLVDSLGPERYDFRFLDERFCLDTFVSKIRHLNLNGLLLDFGLSAVVGLGVADYWRIVAAEVPVRVDGVASVAAELVASVVCMLVMHRVVGVVVHLPCCGCHGGGGDQDFRTRLKSFVWSGGW